MKAVLFRGKGHPLLIAEAAKPTPVNDQVLIRLRYAALNHRDIWTMQEPAQNIKDGVILGSDGAGVVEAVGEKANPSLVGTEVIINPSLEWGSNPNVQSGSFKILGFPDNGTFAEYIVISQKSVVDKPRHLSLQESAAVPLSALTAYRALFSKARLRAKEKILITGVGGGAGLWVLQFAVASQAKVFVTSGNPEKLKVAASLGSLAGFNYRDSAWVEQAKEKSGGGFDVIIDSAGGNQFGKLIELALPGGRVVNFGRTAGNITDVITRQLYWKQISILGTTMGTHDEFLSMIDFIENHTIKPVIDSVFPLTQVQQAFERMEQGNQVGKIVLEIDK
jgi:zinc-binding alcohol dehydrogenase/oxidoreductase